MIYAMIFDLDGTLVRTEELKARSYARAAAELRPDAIDEADVFEAYQDVVGRSREEVATALLERFDLETTARARMDELDAPTPWEAFVAVRMQHYEALIGDPDVVRRMGRPDVLAVLRYARKRLCKVALATTSRRDQAQRVLNALGIADQFNMIATADDVRRTKPHPEVYRYVLTSMRVGPKYTLAIEDSPAGVEAARTAGVHLLAVATDFTRDTLSADARLAPERIIDDTADLHAAVRGILDRETARV